MHYSKHFMFIDINSTNANIGIECHSEQSINLIEEKGGFDWDAQTQGLVLSSFSFGYFSTQLIGGILAEQFNAKWIFGVCLFICFALEFVIPLAANGSVFVLMGARAIQGVSYFMFNLRSNPPSAMYYFTRQPLSFLNIKWWM